MCIRDSDKMAGAAEELREQAEKKASEINAAYDRIKTCLLYTSRCV